MTDVVLVPRLAAVYDAFNALFNDVGLLRAALDTHVERARPRRAWCVGRETRKQHIARIRFFVDAFRRGDHVDPIVIDNACANGVIYPEPIIIDGHHRFLAAQVANVKTIRCEYSGRVDVLRYLQGKRKRLPT